MDSRLTSRALAKLPRNEGPTRGFEMVNERALIAYTGGAWAAIGGRQLLLRANDTLEGLAADSNGEVRYITAEHGFRVTMDGFAADPKFSLRPDERIVGSGGPGFLRMIVRKGTTSFFAYRPDGATRLVAKVKGVGRLVSWTAQGMAAVIGNDLLVWDAAGGGLKRMLRTPLLAGVRDLTLAGTDRVVISTDAGLVLVTADNALVLAVAHGHPRYVGSKLYLVEDDSPALWEISGLDDVGNRANDERHARRLWETAGSDALDDPRLMEAVRIVGCRQIDKWKAAR
jgi:hypothetical protein